MADDERTRRNTVKACITWLHARANTMNDPSARAAMNTAAFHMGVEFKTHNPATGAPLHDSGCAMHNMPAMPNGPCDCSVSRGRGAVPEEQIARVIRAKIRVTFVAKYPGSLETQPGLGLDGVEDCAREIFRLINGGGV